MKDIQASEVKVRFYLRVGSEFYSERQVLENLQELVKLAKRKKIDILTTDGALSITYGSVELLGIEFWDEINLFCSGLVY